MQDYEFNFYEYKKRITSQTSGVPIIVLIFVCIILIGAILFLKPEQTKHNSFYFVEINNFLVLSDAQTLSVEIRNKGGAGYIYFDGKYHVLASYYPNKNDAEIVCKNLKQDYKTATIYELKINKNVNLKNLSNNQKNAVENFISCGYSTIEKIYKNILSFDKAEITEAQFNLNFNSIYNNFEDVANGFNSNFLKASKYDKAKTYLAELNKILTEFNTVSKQDNFKQKSKFNMISFVVNFSNVLSCF